MKFLALYKQAKVSGFLLWQQKTHFFKTQFYDEINMSKWLLRTLFWFSILITTYYTLMNLYDCLRRAKAQRELLPPAVRGVVTKCPNINLELSKLMSMKKKKYLRISATTVYASSKAKKNNVKATFPVSGQIQHLCILAPASPSAAPLSHHQLRYHHLRWGIKFLPDTALSILLHGLLQTSVLIIRLNSTENNQNRKKPPQKSFTIWVFPSWWPYFFCSLVGIVEYTSKM